MTPTSDDDSEPQFQTWGEAKRKGGAVAWEELADDLLDEEGPEPGGPEEGVREDLAEDAADATSGSPADAGQPDWGRPPVARFHEDLWPVDLDERSSAEGPSRDDAAAEGGDAWSRPDETAMDGGPYVAGGEGPTFAATDGGEDEDDPLQEPDGHSAAQSLDNLPVGGFEVVRDRRDPVQINDDLGVDDEPEVRKDRSRPTKAMFEMGHVEVRQDARSGIRHVRDLEEE